MRKTKLLSILSFAVMLTSCSKTLNNSSSTISSSISSSTSSSEEIDDVVFNYYSDSNGLVTINDIETKNIKELIIPSYIDGNEVVSISSNAINNLPNLKKIYIPKTVISIRSINFANCPNLETIEIDNDNPMYSAISNCIVSKDEKTLVKGIKTSIIPDTVTTIQSYAFFYSNVTSIKLPKGVSSYGTYFYHCDDLIDFQIDEKNPYYSSPKGSNCWLSKDETKISDIFKNGVIPDTVTKFVQNTFTQGNVTELHITKNMTLENITNTSDATFTGLYNLEKVTVDPQNSKYASVEGSTCILTKTNGVLRLYKMLGKDVVIPEGVVGVDTSGVGYNFFARALLFVKSIHIPKSFVEEGRQGMFIDTDISKSALEKITVEEGNPKYAVKNNCLYTIDKKAVYLAANNASVPEDAVTIKDCAFSGTNIENVYFPASLNDVSYDSFSYCNNLKTLEVDKNNTVYYSNSYKDNIFQKKDNELFLATNDSYSHTTASQIARTTYMNVTDFNFSQSIKRTRTWGFSNYTIDLKPDSINKADLSQSSIEIIENLSFLNRYDIKEILLPNTLTDLWYNSLYSTGITSLTIPASVKSINYNFISNTPLKKLVLPDLSNVRLNISSSTQNIFTRANCLQDLTINMTVAAFKKVVSKLELGYLLTDCKLLKTIKFLEYENSSNYIDIDVDKIY